MSRLSKGRAGRSLLRAVSLLVALAMLLSLLPVQALARADQGVGVESIAVMSGEAGSIAPAVDIEAGGAGESAGLSVALDVYGEGGAAETALGERRTTEAQASAETPTFTTDLSTTEVVYTVGDAAAALGVAAGVSDGGTISYQWYSNTTKSTDGGTAINDATGTSYTTSTENPGTTYYYVIATNTLNESSATAASSIATVTVTGAQASAETPVFSIDLSTDPVTYTVGDDAAALTVEATVTDGGEITYQWYGNTSESTTGGTVIEDAAAASYTPSTAGAGTTYYYVIATNTLNGATATATSSISTVTVTTMMMISGGLAYSGQTDTGNYTISTAAQLVKLAEMVNAGTKYSGSTFTLQNDIDLSTVCGEDINGSAVSWTPIGNSLLRYFGGTFDGNFKTVSGLYISSISNYQGLFACVNKGTVKNLTVSCRGKPSPGSGLPGP